MTTVDPDARRGARQLHSGGIGARLLNPLWIRGLRSRGRLHHLLSWGVVVFTIASFISLMTYTTITEHHLASPADAAKMVLPGLIILQAVILMMVGTNAAAGGIARERDEGLLDYQRMTPMSPTAKIIGCLFGLPMREYVLFAITLPLLALAVLISGFDLLTLAHFYLVFFSSVWVYHMTALVTGTVTLNPRTATLLAVGLVVMLYLVLPNLSHLGLSFFEYLTIRPTFFGLIEQELPDRLRSTFSIRQAQRFRDVPFFNGAVHPTVYTLVVQGFVLGTLFTVLHRRWRNETSHLVSKVGGVIIFAGITLFLFGSVWAIVAQDEAHARVFSRIHADYIDPVRIGRSLETLTLLLLLSTLIIGGAYLILVTAMTPERSTVREGWRRVRKLGLARLGFNSDAASSLPSALVMILLMLGAGGALLWLIEAKGDYFARNPSLSPIALLAAALVGIMLFIQGLRERFGLRIFALCLFVFWCIPFFATMILSIAFEAVVAGAYVALPCPPATVGFALVNLFESTLVPPSGDAPPLQLLPRELEGQAPGLSMTGSLCYLAAGILMQVAARSHRARLRALEPVAAQ